MTLLLLHGAIGAAKQLEPLALRLSEHYKLNTIDFTGHGGSPVPTGDFSIKLFANDVLKWMEKHSISSVDIFGYSMGGYVGLYLARHYPEKINKLFTLATKLDWNTEMARREVKMLDPASITEKIPAFAETLAKRHHPADWKKVLEKTVAMMLAMGDKNVLTSDDYSHITQPVVLSVGDKDKMVSIDETKAVAGYLKNGQTLVLPDTSHPIEAVDVSALALHTSSFFAG